MRKFLFFLVLVAFLPAFGFADMGSYVSGQLDSIKDVARSVRGHYVSTQERGYFSLGGYRDRFDLTGTVYPLSVTLPTMASGCGGIDINWGGFSFLKFENAVELFKQILQTAPAFAFSLALSTLCEDCNAVMQSLQKAASQINALSLDKCKTAQIAGAYGAYGLKKLTGVVGLNALAGSYENYMEGMKQASADISNAVDLFRSSISPYVSCSPEMIARYGSCEEAVKAKMGLENGSLLYNAFSEQGFQSAFGDGGDVEALVRGLVGDVVVRVSARELSTRVIPPNSTVTPDKLASVIFEGGTARGLRYDGSTGSVLPVDVTVPPEGSVYALVRGAFQRVYDSLKSGASPDPADLEFLSISPIASYRVINLLVAVDSEKASDSLDVLAYVTAERALLDILSRTLDLVGNVVSAYSTPGTGSDISRDIREFVEDFHGKVSTLKSRVRERYRSHLAELIQKIDMTRMYAELERRVLSAVSRSTFYGQYLFSKTLSR